MKENVPTIHVFNSISSHHKPSSTTSDNRHFNPLPINILTQEGTVNITELHMFQDQLVLPTPTAYFTPHHNQYIRIDSGANVHATTNKSDFLILYHQQKTINIAAGQVTQSKGFGVVMVQLIPNHPPLLLAPVYYCPTVSTGTLSPQCLHLYYKCKAPTHK